MCALIKSREWMFSVLTVMERILVVTTRYWPSCERWIPRGCDVGAGASSSVAVRISGAAVEEEEGETMLTQADAASDVELGWWLCRREEMSSPANVNR